MLYFMLKSSNNTLNKFWDYIIIILTNFNKKGNL